MYELVEAAGNVVFALIMNSIRELYFARAELFSALVAEPDELAPLYRRGRARGRERRPGPRRPPRSPRWPRPRSERLLEALR